MRNPAHAFEKMHTPPGQTAYNVVKYPSIDKYNYYTEPEYT